ncbi:MAG: hypothetical protein R3C05_02285 [Pirellulaceae bacterium]
MQGIWCSGQPEAGGGNHLVAVRPGQKPEEVYRFERSAPYVPTPVVVDDMIFVCGDAGVVSCISATDGSTHWNRRVGGTISPRRLLSAISC